MFGLECFELKALQWPLTPDKPEGVHTNGPAIIWIRLLDEKMEPAGAWMSTHCTHARLVRKFMHRLGGVSPYLESLKPLQLETHSAADLLELDRQQSGAWPPRKSIRTAGDSDDADQNQSDTPEPSQT